MRLLLCSGGLDSISLMAVRHDAGDEIAALFVNYGQLNAAEEVAAAQHFCDRFAIQLIVAEMQRAFPPSGLSDDEGHYAYLPGKSRFFLPARNAVFISLAISWAMRLDCDDIMVGSVHADRTHLDSGPDFIARMDALARICSDGKVGLSAPFIDLRKGEMIALAAKAIDPAELFSHTWSCYHPRGSDKIWQFDWGQGCGSCLSCRGRRAALGMDPETGEP